jgi:hypothetical protein
MNGSEKLPQVKDDSYILKQLEVSPSRRQTAEHGSQTSSAQYYERSLLAHKQYLGAMLFWVKVCQWPVVSIGARKVFQRKIPLIPIKLKELTSTFGKTQGGYKEPTGKRVSFIGKRNERCQRITWWTTPEEKRWKGRDISIEIDQVDHGEIWLLPKRYQANYLPETGGHVLTPFFGKVGSRRDKEIQHMERVQSADWRKNRVVNEIRRWSEEFSPDSRLAGHNNRPVYN